MRIKKEVFKFRDPNKPLFLSLTSYFGVGPSSAKALCIKAGVNPFFPSSATPLLKLAKIRLSLSRDFIIGAKLRYNQNEVYKGLAAQKCYRGRRLSKGLPVRGQRTHSNANTANKLKTRYNLR